LDKDLEEEMMTIELPRRMFVKEKIGDIFKIEINKKAGYIRQSEVKILD